MNQKTTNRQTAQSGFKLAATSKTHAKRPNFSPVVIMCALRQRIPSGVGLDFKSHLPPGLTREAQRIFYAFFSMILDSTVAANFKCNLL